MTFKKSLFILWVSVLGVSLSAHVIETKALFQDQGIEVVVNGLCMLFGHLSVFQPDYTSFLNN